VAERPRLSLVASEFDPALLPTRELAAYNLANELAKLPPGRTGGPVRTAQLAIAEGEPRLAIEALTRHLDAHGVSLDPAEQRLDHRRVREVRKLRGRKQAEVAVAIGSTNAQVSQMEGGKHLALPRLLMICDFLDVRLADFVLKPE